MKLSVLMITYNHEEFLAEAIDSVLMQEVNFDYEIVIGEDCSTDNTRGICIDYRKRFPDKIRLLLPEKNLGAVRNLVQTLCACKGQYVAILEGDDYWSSPYKLAKQVEFLDNHPECAICSCDAAVHRMADGWVGGTYPILRPRSITTQRDLLSGNYIITCTSMFRGGLIKEFPDWFCDLRMADWPLHVMNAAYGKIGHIYENLAVYRVHAGGLWWGADAVGANLDSIVNMYDVFRNKLNIKFGRREFGAELHWSSALHEHRGEISQAKSDALRSFILCPVNRRLSERPHHLLLRLCAPWLMRSVSRLRGIIFGRRAA